MSTQIRDISWEQIAGSSMAQLQDRAAVLRERWARLGGYVVREREEMIDILAALAALAAPEARL